MGSDLRPFAQDSVNQEYLEDIVIELKFLFERIRWSVNPSLAYPQSRRRIDICLLHEPATMILQSGIVDTIRKTKRTRKSMP